MNQVKSRSVWRLKSDMYFEGIGIFPLSQNLISSKRSKAISFEKVGSCVLMLII